LHRIVARLDLVRRFAIPHPAAMSIAENIAVLQARIAHACEKAGRSPDEILLLAVSKGQSAAAVDAACRAGLRCFGESKVQEAKLKIPLCPGALTWHMIGHLQTNKCRDAVELFAMIHSVDSLHLAEEISRRCEPAGRTMPVLLEVNVAGESSKFGYSPARLLDELAAVNALPRIAIHGLMTIAPYTTVTGNARPFFQRLRELKQRCEDRLGASLPHLSMGMSGDFETAIEEGATIVRVGTALFGERTAGA
jgi:pyridoxal phosphate enzyme (YggS family)